MRLAYNVPLEPTREMSDTSAFQSSQLILRPFESADLPALLACLNHPELAGRRYLPWGFPDETPLSSKQVEAVLQKWDEAESEAHLAIILREDQVLIGHASFDWDWDPHCPNLSIVIAPDRQRCGYGSEVLQLLLRYLFENTPAHNVSGWMADWNQAARLFARRYGFQESGRSRREGLRHGAYFDEILVDLLRPEWRATQEG
jgi:[ribosomal protein S5]-alanine N-acetyltransferase